MQHFGLSIGPHRPAMSVGQDLSNSVLLTCVCIDSFPLMDVCVSRSVVISESPTAVPLPFLPSYPSGRSPGVRLEWCRQSIT